LEIDVLVVGAGPAGCTTARYCSDKRLEVMVIDRREEIGYPVQCGEFLPEPEEMHTIFPRSMDLEELFAVDGRFVTGESEHLDIISPKNRAYRCDFRGRTLDRRRFDKHLARLAQEAGARVETGVSLKAIENGIARTTKGDLSARVIVAADGPNSRTARSAGLQNPAARYPAVTSQARGSFEQVVKMYFGRVAPGGYAWVIPKREGANIGVGVNPSVSRERPGKLFERFAGLLGCEFSSLTMGIVPMSGPVKTTVRGNVLLVGDSAGFVMPTNGGGIPTAMIGGRIAGRAVKDHLLKGSPLSNYERQWRTVMDRPLKVGLWTKNMADMFFPRDSALELAMMILGARGLDRAIRCKRVFHVV